MGNIIQVTPGDLVDRQTILDCKLKYAGKEDATPKSDEILEQTKERAITRTKLMDKGSIVQPFIIEHEAIQTRLEREWFHKLTPSSGAEFDRLLEKLINVNSELWRLENQARVLRGAPDKHSELVYKRKSECLDAITLNNDARMELVIKINALFGIVGEEKIYQ